MNVLGDCVRFVADMVKRIANYELQIVWCIRVLQGCVDQNLASIRPTIRNEEEAETSALLVNCCSP